jgi:DNA polymerase-3 subunit delta'
MSRKADAADISPRPFEWRDPYPWQIATLAEHLREPERVPQSLLIYGASGIGKLTLAMNLARSLLCESPTADGLACGHCDSCRYVSKLEHPDLMLIEPLDYDEKKDEWKKTEFIPVKHIREMINDMQVTSFGGRGKVAVIVPAEKMNLAASNALLKTLEEPTAGNRLILVANQWKQLPATVRSRCQFWAAPYPNTATALAFLREQAVADAEKTLHHAGGAPLTALEMADAESAELRARWLTTLSLPQKLSPFAAAQSFGGKRDDNKANLAAWLTLTIGWVTDLARAQVGAVPRFYPEFGESLRKLAPVVAEPALFRFYQTLLRYRYRLAHPLQPRLIVEALLNDYRALFFRPKN